MEPLDYEFIEAKLKDIGISVDIITQLLDIDKLMDLYELDSFLSDMKLIKKIKNIN